MKEEDEQAADKAAQGMKAFTCGRTPFIYLIKTKIKIYT